MSEWDLSSKIEKISEVGQWDYQYLLNPVYVREFIRKIKASYDHSMSWDKFTDMVDKYAGEELIK